MSLYESLVEEQQKANSSGVIDFAHIYDKIAEHLKDHVHNKVVIGAASHGEGLLNNHGLKHVQEVIDWIAKLFEKGYCKPNLCELFLILMAAQVHDIGNISGRKDHEKRINEILSTCTEYGRLDGPTRYYILAIAGAHGGKALDGSKDTLSELETLTQLRGFDIHPRALASVLRMADELADNCDRADVDMRVLDNIPEGNDIYHRYSESIQSVKLEGTTISYKYSLTKDVISRKFGKIEGDTVQKVYLYDEILSRLLKTFCEMEYCCRNSRGYFNLDSISASFTVFSDDFKRRMDQPFGIRLNYKGYPNSFKDISDVIEGPILFESGQKMAEHFASC